MGLKGKLGYRDIADLFNMVETAKKSGVMRITYGRRHARLFFEWGELIRAESNRFSDRIGHILVEHGVISEAEVEEALQIQRAEVEKRRLGCILCAEFSISEADIQDALALQFKAIVSDVVSWPGGEFEFDFELPPDAADRFTLSASEFLLEVGIEAGLLARQSDTGEVRVVLAEADSSFASKLVGALEQLNVKATVAEDVEGLELAVEQDAADVYLVCAALVPALAVFAKADPTVRGVSYGGDGARAFDHFVEKPEDADGEEAFVTFVKKLALAARGLARG